MYCITFNGNLNNLEELDETLRAVFPSFVGLDIVKDTQILHVWFTSSDVNREQLTSYVIAQFKKERYQQLVKDAIEFGMSLITEFAAENIQLGITQAGMTAIVRKRLEEVLNALTTGSLYDAMTAIRAIPAQSYDSVFITPARLLKYLNKLEKYLELPLSETL